MALLSGLYKKKTISIPRFSLDYLDHDKGYVFIEMKSFFEFLTNFSNFEKNSFAYHGIFLGKVYENHI